MNEMETYRIQYEASGQQLTNVRMVTWSHWATYVSRTGQDRYIERSALVNARWRRNSSNQHQQHEYLPPVPCRYRTDSELAFPGTRASMCCDNVANVRPFIGKQCREHNVIMESGVPAVARRQDPHRRQRERERERKGVSEGSWE